MILFCGSSDFYREACDSTGVDLGVRGVHVWILDFLGPASGCFQQDRSEVIFHVAGPGLDLDFVFTEKTLLVLCLTYICRTET